MEPYRQPVKADLESRVTTLGVKSHERIIDF